MSSGHLPTRAGADDLRQRYERIAPFYDLLDLPFEYGCYRSIRPLLFQGLSGRLLDAGVGTGRNMRFYPAGSEVIGLDLSPAMLKRAERRRRLTGYEVYRFGANELIGQAAESRITDFFEKLFRLHRIRR